MLRVKTQKQIIRELQQKDAKNTAKIKQQQAIIDYLAMMADVDLDIEGENKNEQQI